MNREELEAMIWELFQCHCGRVVDGHGFMSRLLHLIDAYAAGDNEKLQKLRHQVLVRERTDIGGRQRAAAGLAAETLRARGSAGGLL